MNCAGFLISADATVAPHSVIATVVNSTVISVRWDGLDPCRRVNGRIVMYRVQYTEVTSGVVQSKDEAGVWNAMNVVTSLTGLTPSTSYSIEVAAVNEEGDVGLYSGLLTTQTCKFYMINISYMWLPPNLSNVIVLAQPNITVGTTTATSISLSWTSAGSEVDSYGVMWQRNTSGEYPNEHEDNISLTDGSTSYDIMGLEADSSYSITVTASNAAGSSAVNNTVTAITLEAGEIIMYNYDMYIVGMSLYKAIYSRWSHLTHYFVATHYYTIPDCVHQHPRAPLLLPSLEEQLWPLFSSLYWLLWQS